MCEIVDSELYKFGGYWEFSFSVYPRDGCNPLITVVHLFVYSDSVKKWYPSVRWHFPCDKFEGGSRVESFTLGKIKAGQKFKFTVTYLCSNCSLDICEYCFRVYESEGHLYQEQIDCQTLQPIP